MILTVDVSGLASDWTYLFYPALILVAISALHWRRFRSHVDNGSLLDETKSSGTFAPPSLHPVIDHSRCIGCEACVHACPEFPAHKVLGVVRGKANLITPSDCIGHGACKTACPVNAIKLVFGTAERGIDIPTVKPNFETNVPGIFIAGELGGMGLIRNAIEQGRQALENLLSALQPSDKQGDHVDVVIVGAGPAGLAATLKAQEAGLRYTTIEQDELGGTVAHFPRGKLVMTAPAMLPMVGKTHFHETDKETLMSFWTDVARKTGIKVRCGERVEAIEPIAGGFAVRTDRETHQTRTVLLALGRRGTPRKLNVPGEQLPKVVYRLDDPAQYEGDDVLVVGGGDSALEAALAVAEHGANSVALSYRSESFSRAKPKNRQKIESAEQTGSLRVLLQTTVSEITADEVSIQAGDDLIRLPNNAVIICAGGILPTNFLKETGIDVETKYGTA